MSEEFKFEDGIELISFAPAATKRRLAGFSFSIWNTDADKYGITFSGDFMKKVPETHRCLNFAYNKVTEEMYIIFSKRGDVKVSVAGGSSVDPDKVKNMVLKRRDVINKITPLLKVDFSDPAKKQHVLFWMEYKKDTKDGDQIWVVKGQIEE